MQVILLEKVANLGNLGDQVKVKSGYGRNFLLPRGKATFATKENIAIFEARRAEIEREFTLKLEEAKAKAAQLAELTITINSRAGEEGKLFGAISNQEIVAAIKDAGFEVFKNDIKIANNSIRHTGEYEIPIHLHSEVDAGVRLIVNSI